jgi:hypothetical protein
MSKSVKEIAKESLLKLEAWADERERLGDHANWVYRGGINKVMVAEACGYASTQPFSKNPGVKKRMEAVEKDWLTRGLTSTVKSAPKGQKSGGKSNPDGDDLNDKNLEEAQRRIKSLEERNAVLTAELRKVKRVTEHLDATGRLLPP